MNVKIYFARYFFWPKLSTIPSSSSSVLFFRSLSMRDIVAGESWIGYHICHRELRVILATEATELTEK
jgi:hypothetical protein